jgi:hypothetical protein
MLPVSLACPFLIAWWFSLTSVTFINMNVPIFVKKELFVKTSIPIFKITIFQFVLICHYSDIKNMHESLCFLSSPGFVSLKTRPEVRSMLYKFRLEFIIYLVVSESIAVSEVVFSEYCSQFGAWFSQRIAVTEVVFTEYCSLFGAQRIAVSEVVFSENCSQFGEWFSQRIAVSEVFFSEYCSQFGGFYRELQ